MIMHTPGPWFHDCNGSIWRRNPDELYQNGGTVAGDRPLATVSKGWHHEGAVGYPVEANARLIAAAPELLEAAMAFVAPFDGIEVVKGSVIAKARSAIAKARGEA